MRIGYDSFYSPIGLIHVVVDEIGVKKVELFEEDWAKYKKKCEPILKDKVICKEVISQLEEYFKGKRKNFDIPLSIDGTDFRKKVWKALQSVPYGETRNYLQIAEFIGNPKAVRAVGQANKFNNLPIIIPCHRVIGKGGKLVGFAGNRTPTQKLLLEIEGVNLAAIH